jgi:hypothetical protein
MQESRVKKLTALFTSIHQKTAPKLMQERNGLVQSTGLFVGGEYGKHVIDALVGAEFESLHDEKGFEKTAENIVSVAVYHFKEFIGKHQMKDFLTKTAVVTTEGDRHLLLPNGESKIHRANAKDYLTNRERVIKGHCLLILGQITVTAMGGYKSARTVLDKPMKVLFVGATGPQFEKYGKNQEELDVELYIVKKGAKENKQPLFSHLYENHTIPAHDTFEKLWENVKKERDISHARGEKSSLDALRKAGEGLLIVEEDDPRAVKADVVRLRNGDFFLNKVFKASMYEYLSKLAFPASKQQRMDPTKPDYIKATPFGAGFLSSVGMEDEYATNVKKFVVNSHVGSYIKMLEAKEIEPGTILDFPHYELPNVPVELREAAKKAGVHIIWQNGRDLLDFSPCYTIEGVYIQPAQTHNPIAFGADDPLSYVGNEPDSKSVEAMVGNDSDARFVLNWHSNPHLLDLNRYHEVSIKG